MGNCIRKQSSSQWGGEDWDFAVNYDKEETTTLYSNNAATTKSEKATVTEVKIKITKKQLEELLGKVDVQGLPVQQVLTQLMNFSDRYETNQRSWKPALQSIPEGGEVY